jgi:hypothetical protein
MPLAVVYRRQVGRDLAAGFDYYAAQGPGLAEKFLLHTARDPKLWPRPRREGA